jgi:hypothetical protein
MQEERVTAELCGLYIVDTGLVDSEFDGDVFFLRAGTGLAFLTRSNERFIVRLRPEESTIDSFSDDQGRDLLKNAAGQPVAVQFEFTSPTVDNKAFVMLVSTRSSPAPGATRLNLQANFAVLLAEGMAVRELPTVPLRPGPLTVEGLDTEIIYVGPPKLSLAGGAPFVVHIESRGAAMDLVQSLEFFDANGTQLSTIGLSLPPAGGKLVTEYGLTKEVESATLRFTLWINTTVQIVPITQDIRLGIGPVRP